MSSAVIQFHRMESLLPFSTTNRFLNVNFILSSPGIMFTSITKSFITRLIRLEEVNWESFESTRMIKGWNDDKNKSPARLKWKLKVCWAYKAKQKHKRRDKSAIWNNLFNLRQAPMHNLCLYSALAHTKGAKSLGDSSYSRLSWWRSQRKRNSRVQSTERTCNRVECFGTCQVCCNRRHDDVTNADGRTEA